LELNPNLKGKTLDEVIESKCEDYVFVTRYGERAARPNLSRNFETLLKSLKIVYGADGKKRTLYSWRHFYATLDLQRGISTHALSRQMGNSTGVLDRFYSKLSPFMNPGLHSGRDQQEQRNAAKDRHRAAASDNKSRGRPRAARSASCQSNSAGTSRRALQISPLPLKHQRMRKLSISLMLASSQKKPC
jgi:hypothetical protein